ncbi:MAG: tetratricopeptide repeat protein [Muribaculaceae bacterium]|nr:tetratricopeptide repeat protein [Muribaculaceae bacterium]
MKRLLLSGALMISLAAASQINSPAPDGYLERAAKMFADGNYAGCIDQAAIFRQQAADGISHEQADYLTAMSAAHMQKTDAEPLLRYFIWKYPQSPLRWDARLSLAKIAVDNQQFESVGDYLNKIDPARLTAPQKAQYNFITAVNYLHHGELSSAKPLFASLTGNKSLGNDSRFYLGYIDYYQGNLPEALKTFKSIRPIAGTPAGLAPYYISQIYFAQNNYAQAATTATPLINDAKVAPAFRAEACRIVGESQWAEGESAAAISTLEKYLTLTNEPAPSALYILGYNDYQHGRYAEAIERLTPAGELDNTTGQSALLTIGQALIAQGNYTPAMIALEKAYKMNHDSDVKEAALYNFAVAKTEGGKVPFGSTVAILEDYLREFPNSANANAIRRYMVHGYITDNNLPAALASINAIQKPSADIIAAKQQVLYTMGAREVSAGEFDQAITHLREAQKIKTDDKKLAAEIHLWLGEAYFGLTNYSKAADEYQSALKGNNLSEGNRAEALYSLAYCYFNSDNRTEALNNFNRYVAQNPASKALEADAYNRIADCYYANSKFTDAAAAYAKAAQLNPATADYPLFQQAMIKGFSGNNNRKIDELQALISRFPESPLAPVAWLETAQAYDQLHKGDKAIEAYSLVATRYPSTRQGREAYLLMAMAYINNGNRSQAIDSYKKLITSAPQSDEAGQAVESLKTLLANDGRLEEFASFMAQVPGVAPLQADQLEQAAFAAAERQYLQHGKSARLLDYIERYPNGANMAQALAYAMKANATAGNNAVALDLANRLINNYPGNPSMGEALLTKGDILLKQGNPTGALDAYTALRSSSSTPGETNAALLGIINAATDLGDNDKVIEAADVLLASSTPSASQIAQAALARGQALSLSGRPDEAQAQWEAITGDLTDINATKAAFYIANQQFEQGKLDEAAAGINRLIDSDTPHIYWLARSFILLSDINRAKGNKFEADQYLLSLRQNYPGSESDIINMIDARLKK